MNAWLDKELSVLLPAYNEAENIAKLVDEASALLKQLTRQYEIVIIDDGSKDKTLEVATRLASVLKNIKVVHYGKHKGMGYAIRQGILHAQYDRLLYMDADNQIKPDALKDIFEVPDPAEMVIGYRVGRKDGFLRSQISLVYNKLITFIFGFKARDINCGFKCFHRKAFDLTQLCSDNFFFSAELLIRARRNGVKIKEFPIVHHERLGGKSSVSFFSLPGTLRDFFCFLFSVFRGKA